MRMRQIIDECVDCGLPCHPHTCPHKNSVHYYCDECGDECYPNELYIHEDSGMQLCKECILSHLETVE